jgi:hypothetical protein
MGSVLHYAKTTASVLTMLRNLQQLLPFFSRTESLICANQ